MKNIILTCCLSLITVSVYAQATEGTVRLQKTEQPAATIELPYSSDIVKEALNDYLSKKGKSKGTDLKGFTTFRNTQSVVSGNDNADLYFKIEQKSRQDRGFTIVSLLLTKPSDEKGTTTELNYLNMEQAKAYLNGLTPAIEDYNLELMIKEQNQVVIKSESTYKTQFNNGAELEQKRTELETRILENKTEQEKYQADVNTQKQKLTDLVNRRK
ncbi:MAG: hypothetical protein J0L80_09100 [Chitinophagales bacterium]|nr:hypothetical protein [Chitinophagales bacterium]